MGGGRTDPNCRKTSFLKKGLPDLPSDNLKKQFFFYRIA